MGYSGPSEMTTAIGGRSMTVSERLYQQKKDLTERLTNINAAIEAVEKVPNLQEALDAIAKVGY